MAGRSIDDILRQQAAQRQAEIQRQQAQERAIYEQRERARQDYIQRARMYEKLSNFNPSAAAAAGGSKADKPVFLEFTSYGIVGTTTVDNLVGTITDYGTKTVVEVGFVWSTLSGATKDDYFDTDGTNNPFTIQVSGLNYNTDYYFRPYAIDSDGVTYYGDEQMLTTEAHVPGVDFTIEWFMNMTSWPSHPRPYSLGQFNTNPKNAVSIESGGTHLYWWTNGTPELNGTFTAPSTGTWHHYTVTRDNGQLSAYLDGVRFATDTYTSSMIATGLPLYIGSDLSDSGAYVNGYITNFRWTTEVVYTGATFTVPTSPLTSTANTKFLMLNSGTASLLVDSSTYSRTITNNATASWSSLSPFSGVGGSVHFTGANYLSIPASTDWDL